MKKQLPKRLLSGFMAVIMVLIMLPCATIGALADGNNPTIVVDTKKAAEGGSTTVNISLQNNPGITSMRIYVAYDDTRLKLTDVKYSSDIGGTPVMPENIETSKSPVILYWSDSFSNYTGNGVFATLTFDVTENAKAGDWAEINVTYSADDIYDINEDNVTFDVDAGGVSIVGKVAGDINSDGNLNTKDTTRIMRYHAGWDVEVNESALDVNGDGSYNTKDTTRLMRYLAGWDVEIYIDGVAVKKCNHTMEAVAYKAATCTEDGNISYNYCTTCEKYFNDSNGTTELTAGQTILKATGHSAVTDPAVDPTPTDYGWTEGSHCSVCGEVLVAQEEIPPIERNEYYIYYHYTDNDVYLQELDEAGKITNENPSTYSEDDSVTLINLSVTGYVFEGWYDGMGSNATQIKKIENQTGTVHLFAHWTKVQYTVQFDSPLVPMEARTFDVSTGLTLAAPSELPGYVFMGWSDVDGNLVSQIPAGTAKNITLYGNWTSARNQTRPVSSLGDPIIYFDEENYRILFAYEIGTIENIPLEELEYIGNLMQGVEISESITTAVSVDESMAEEVSKAVSNATTNSSEWTLSNEWTSSTSISEEYLHEVDSAYSYNSSYAVSNSGTFNIGTSSSRSTTIATETGVSAKIGAKVTKEVSVGFPLEDINIGAKVGGEISGEVGKEVTQSKSDTKTWNVNAGYEASRQESTSHSLTSSLAEKISESVSYDISNSATESTSNTKSTASTSTDTREYASAFTYSTSTIEEKTYTVTLSNAPAGYYRMVAAGRAHVYAVVTYDIATNAYGVFSYSIMEDTVRPFLDYSKESSAFDDNENGVLPFAVPYYVNDYVDSIIGASDGLVVDIDTGVIESYTGNDNIVIIPQYMPVDTGDGTTVVKITGFEANAFAGNTELKAVQLCKNITEIPAGAFEGCSSLILVTGSTVTSIGENAFAGCTSLKDYTIGTNVTFLGDNAFKNVGSLTVTACNVLVADAAIASGAKNIVLNLDSVSGSISDRTYNISFDTEKFTLNGAGGTYSNVIINSDAQTTVINNAVFNHSTDMPLVISSANVTLNRVTATAPGIALKLTADSVNVGLYGSVSISSGSGNAAIGKNVNFYQSSSSVVGKISLGGNFLYSDSVSGQNYASFTSDAYGFVYIDSENPVILNFDANGGSTDESTRLVYGGTAVGELPAATRDYYTFTGWYTAAEGGDEITADMILATDLTAYAHWTQNEVSDWVLASELPSGAEVIEEKWTYTETLNTESTETSLDGYTQTGSYWVNSGSGSFEYSDKFSTYAPGFDTSNSIYTSLNKSPYTSSETETTKREVSTAFKGYVYWHWMYDCGGANATDRSIFYKKDYGSSNLTGNSYYYKYFNAFKSTTNYSGQTSSNWGQNDTYYKWYHVTDKTSNADTGGSYWFYRFEYYTCSYTDYYKMFQYEKVEELESTTEVTESDTISNVQEWVKYREK